MSENSMADFVPFLAYLLFLSNSTRIKTNKWKKDIYFTHKKEKNIRNIVRLLKFQQLLVSKHRGLRDSMLSWQPSESLHLVTDKTMEKNKPQVDYESLLVHGCAVDYYNIIVSPGFKLFMIDHFGVLWPPGAISTLKIIILNALHGCLIFRSPWMSLIQYVHGILKFRITERQRWLTFTEKLHFLSRLCAPGNAFKW